MDGEMTSTKLSRPSDMGSESPKSKRIRIEGANDNDSGSQSDGLHAASADSGGLSPGSSASRQSDFSDDDSSEDAEQLSRNKYVTQLKRYLTNEDSLLMPSTTFALAKWIWLKQIEVADSQDYVDASEPASSDAQDMDTTLEALNHLREGNDDSGNSVFNGGFGTRIYRLQRILACLDNGIKPKEDSRLGAQKHITRWFRNQLNERLVYGSRTPKNGQWTIEDYIKQLDKRVTDRLPAEDAHHTETPLFVEDLLHQKPWRELLMEMGKTCKASNTKNVPKPASSSFFNYVLRRMTDRGFFNEIPSELSVSSLDFKVYSTRLCSLIARARFCTEDTMPEILKELKIHNNHIHTHLFAEAVLLALCKGTNGTVASYDCTPVQRRVPLPRPAGAAAAPVAAAKSAHAQSMLTPGKHTFIFVRLLQELRRDYAQRPGAKGLTNALSQRADTTEPLHQMVNKYVSEGKVTDPKALWSLCVKPEEKAPEVNPTGKRISEHEKDCKEIRRCRASAAALLRSSGALPIIVKQMFSPWFPIPYKHRKHFCYLAVAAACLDGDQPSSKSVATCNTTYHLLSRASIYCNMARSVKEKKPAFENAVENGIRMPMIAMGVLHWIEECWTNSKASNFHVHWDILEWTLRILRLVVDKYPLQRDRVFQLLLGAINTSPEVLDASKQNRRKLKLMTDIVRLMAFRGFALKVIREIISMKAKADKSLIRHFVESVLQMVKSPYSVSFAKGMLNILSYIVHNQAFSMKSEMKKKILKFAKDCSAQADRAEKDMDDDTDNKFNIGDVARKQVDSILARCSKTPTLT